MSLIEYLLRDTWEESLRRAFEVVVRVLDKDPFMHLATSGDDLRACLRAGGVARLREAVRSELRDSRIDQGHQKMVLEGLERLIVEHRQALSDLAKRGIIPSAGLSPVNGEGADRAGVPDGDHG